MLVGGGGREHALAWKVVQDDPSVQLIAVPGNPGIGELGRCLPVAATDIPTLLETAVAQRVDLVIVGPEAPLAAGIADRFRDAGIPLFGPTRAAAQIETSKTFAKRLMEEAGVPTARAERHVDAAAAKRAARAFGVPVVIKASGLASGKGVLVCGSEREADDAIDAMLVRRAFGAAGSEVLVEEFMEGEELSLFALTDGERAVPMVPAQDHKRLLDGDSGPNTGGMGAYAPVSTATPRTVAEVERRVIGPVLSGLRERGHAFTGLLYAGLMMTTDGPRVVEFNCRFGDPETQALLPLLESPLLPLLLTIGAGERLGHVALQWRSAYAVATVVAADGYPDSPRKGDPITLGEHPDGVLVFHAGTARDDRGRLVTAGGRVFAVSAVAPTLPAARDASLRAAESIEFAGKHYRTDIGWRDLQRHAGAARD